MSQREEVVVYLMFPNFKEPTHILYLLKNKKGHICENKLLGIGGGVEKYDDSILSAAKREIAEETQGKIKYSNLEYIGDISYNLHVLRGNLDEKIIDTIYSDRKELINLFPIDYHRLNPKYFLESDLKMLDSFKNSNLDYFKK